MRIQNQNTKTEFAEIDAEAVAGVAKALAHPARVQIVTFLLSRPGCIGGDIVNQIGLAQSTISEHLRILKESGLVVGAIERPRICYSLEPAIVAPLRSLLALIEERKSSDDNTDCCPI